MVSHKPKLSARNPGRPKKTEKASAGEIEQTILIEAKKLFRQRGYAAVSINDIVQVVGITKPTLYYYYSDKETLYAAVLCHVLEHANHFIQSGLAQNTPLREQLLVLTAGFLKNAPTSLCMLLRDTQEHLSAFPAKHVYDTYEALIIAPLTQMFETATERREIKVLDTNGLAHIFVSLLDTLLISLTVQYGKQYNPSKLAQTLITSFMDGISTP